MNERRASLEVIAPSIEEAIEKGLADLGLPAEAVEIEVLDSGSRGLFGLGTRQARIRLSIRTDIETVEVKLPEVEQVRESESGAPEAEEEVVEELLDEEIEAEEIAEVGADDELALGVARDIVSELIQKMKVRAQVVAHFGEPEDARSRAPLLVDITGDDLNLLIGPRAETLNALQYIVNLMVGKELGRSIPLVVDVEGYRQRRAQQVRQLARRMADQAVKTGKRQVLEPMPANERRLIHIELRNHPNVTTESIGEEPRRKVTIIPQ